MKKKAKHDNQCPHCDYGTLIPAYHDDQLQCSVCLIYFDKLTREALSEETVIGASRVLACSVQEMKQEVIKPFDRAFARLIHWLIDRFVD